MAQASRTAASAPLRVPALLALALCPASALERLREAGSAGERTAQVGEDRPALGGIDDCLADAHFVGALSYNQPVPWPQAKPITDRLGNDDLALGTHLVRGGRMSHTDSITNRALD
jgi:hypothetical protein